MRTLEELAVAACDGSWSVVHDLIAHVQQQAEQIATLTRDVDALDDERVRLLARVEALEASAGKVQTPAKLDAGSLGVGAKVLIPGEVVEVDAGMLRVRYAATGSDAYHAWCRPEQVRPEPAAPPPPAAPAPASDDYEARARGYLADLWGAPAELEPFEGDVLKLVALLRTVADEARREERAACEAVCREVAEDSLWAAISIATGLVVAAGDEVGVRWIAEIRAWHDRCAVVRYVRDDSGKGE